MIRYARGVMLLVATAGLAACSAPQTGANASAEADTGNAAAKATASTVATAPDSELDGRLKALAETSDAKGKAVVLDLLKTGSAERKRDFLAGAVALPTKALLATTEDDKPPKCKVKVHCRAMPLIDVDFCFISDSCGGG